MDPVCARWIPIPARRHRPPATWTSRYLKPAPVAWSVLFNQTRGEKIPGKGDAESGARVDERSDVLAVILDVKGIHESHHGHDRKNVREDEAEAVDSAEHEVVSKD
jgi:hypothetical protein